MHIFPQQKEVFVKQASAEVMSVNALGSLDVGSAEGQRFWEGYLIAVKASLAVGILVLMGGWMSL